MAERSMPLPCCEASSLRRAFKEALLEVDRAQAMETLARGVAGGWRAEDLAQDCITPVLEEIGEAWESGSLALSQIYMAGRLAEESVESLFPLRWVRHAEGPVVAIALLEDFHALGKRLVQLMLRAAGCPPVDLGRVTAEELVAKVLEDPPDLVLVSTLMLRSALRVERVKTGLLAAGCRVPICVGGAPFRLDPGLWKEVGADGCGTEAADALGLVKEFARRRA